MVKRVVVMLLLVSSLVACGRSDAMQSAATSLPEVKLELKLTPGTTFKTQTVLHTDLIFPDPLSGRSIDTDITTQTLAYTVLESPDPEEIRLETSFVEPDQQIWERINHSTGYEDSAALHTQIYTAGFTSIYAPNGLFHSPEIQAFQQVYAQNLDTYGLEGGYFDMFGVIRQYRNPEADESFLYPTFVMWQYPEQALKVGDSWTTLSWVDFGHTAPLSMTYTLVDVKDGVAFISADWAVPFPESQLFELRGPWSDNNGEASLQVTPQLSAEVSSPAMYYTATVEIDLATGWPNAMEFQIVNELLFDETEIITIANQLLFETQW